MPSDTRKVVMWNPSAGTAQSADDVKQRLLETPGIVIREPGDRESAVKETFQAAADGADLIVAAGGDGTERGH